MKRNTYRTAILIFAALAVLASSPSTRTAARAAANLSKPSSSDQRPSQAGQQRQFGLLESYGKVPLSFEANRGQADSQVTFLSRGSGYTLFLTGDEAVLALETSRKLKVESRKPRPEPGSANLFTRSAAFGFSGLRSAELNDNSALPRLIPNCGASINVWFSGEAGT